MNDWNAVALEDINGDGDVDVYLGKKDDTANRSNVPNEIWLNNGDGTFRDSGQRLGDGATYSVVLADVDGDGDLDAVAVSPNGDDGIWFNNDGNPLPGDSNCERRFDQLDIVQVLQAAKYLTGESAAFEEGDWNGDRVFDQLDLIAALQVANYLPAPSVERST